MYAFAYHRPQSLEEVKSLLEQADDPKILAGGHTLLPTMKQRLAMPTDLIDIGRLQELKGIEAGDKSVVIGAGETHASVAEASDVKARIPGLASLASTIGDPHVRHMGTLGGSVANNDPSADYPAACLGLDATIHTTERSIASDEFFGELFETALDENELITKIEFQIPERSAYKKFPNPASRYAIVGVFVAQGENGIRVAMTGAAPGVRRLGDFEAELAKSFTPDAVADLKVSAEGLNSDIHASAEYRAHLVTVMAKRAVAAANETRSPK